MILTLIYFVLILGTTIVVHEFGHFLFAKLTHTYVYEFSIGMGKKIWSFKRKNDETEYSLRLVPIGGFVRLAGEEAEDEKKFAKDQTLLGKSFWQRFLIMFAGAGFNFIFAFLLLFVIALIFGSNVTRPIIGEVASNYPMEEAGVVTGSTIISINDQKVNNWDRVFWILQEENGKTLNFIIKDPNGITKTYTVTPILVENETGSSYKFGMSVPSQKEHGIVSSFNYAVSKMGSLFRTMFDVVTSLFTGGVKVSDLSGPVGIYSIVDQQSKQGFDSILYLMAFLSINVGFINLIPFPAFDGGRILFLIIEKIKGSPLNPKIENTVNNIGFMLLILLMLYVTFNDILRLF